MYKKLFATLLVVCLGLFSVSFASSAVEPVNDNFSSPLAKQSYYKDGDIQTNISIEKIASNYNNTEVGYNSMGCSNTCTNACTNRCSNTCSMNSRCW